MNHNQSDTSLFVTVLFLPAKLFGLIMEPSIWAVFDEQCKAGALFDGRAVSGSHPTNLGRQKMILIKVAKQN